MLSFRVKQTDIYANKNHNYACIRMCIRTYMYDVKNNNNNNECKFIRKILKV